MTTDTELEKSINDILDDVYRAGLISGGCYADGKGANTITSDALWKAKQSLLTLFQKREREAEHTVYTAVWRHINSVITVMSDKVYLPIQDALQAAKKETGTYPLTQKSNPTEQE